MSGPVGMGWWHWCLRAAEAGGDPSTTFLGPSTSVGSAAFPRKGYSLCLGAAVIAGGGSGLHFHADALRSRRQHSQPFPAEDRRLSSLHLPPHRRWLRAPRLSPGGICSGAGVPGLGKVLGSLPMGCWAPAEPPRLCWAFWGHRSHPQQGSMGRLHGWGPGFIPWGWKGAGMG